MWIQKKDNKYRYFESYKDPMTLKEKTVSITLEKKNQKLAFNLLQEKIDAVTSSPDASNLTFSQLVTKYLSNQLKTVKRTTYTFGINYPYTRITKRNGLQIST